MSSVRREDIELFLMINEPVFNIGEKQYSVCCPGDGFSTWDSDGNTYDFPDIESLLDQWIVSGKPFRDIVESIIL